MEDLYEYTRSFVTSVTIEIVLRPGESSNALHDNCFCLTMIAELGAISVLGRKKLNTG